MRTQRYEALTNAACPPGTEPSYNFRAGDPLELTQQDADTLLKAEAIKPLDTPQSKAVPSGNLPQRGNGNNGGNPNQGGK
jgi:hypothetical protein